MENHKIELRSDNRISDDILPRTIVDPYLDIYRYALYHGYIDIEKIIDNIDVCHSENPDDLPFMWNYSITVSDD